MVRLTKIYTRTGDQGTTALGDGTRVSKTHARIKALGALDEANAALGLMVVFLGNRADLIEKIQHIQNDLFDCGADLCLPGDSGLRISPEKVTKIEQEIDEINRNMPTLSSFILPGGSQSAAFCHLARSILRRAEIQIVAVMAEEVVNMSLLHYINRLSDYLFVLARWINYNKNTEVLWVPGDVSQKALD